MVEEGRERTCSGEAIVYTLIFIVRNVASSHVLGFDDCRHRGVPCIKLTAVIDPSEEAEIGSVAVCILM